MGWAYSVAQPRVGVYERVRAHTYIGTCTPCTVAARPPRTGRVGPRRRMEPARGHVPAWAREVPWAGARPPVQRSPSFAADGAAGPAVTASGLPGTPPPRTRGGRGGLNTTYRGKGSSGLTQFW